MSAMSTDGYEKDADRELRASAMTEKGSLYYREQKDTLAKRVQMSSYMLNDSIQNLQTLPLPKSLAALESVETDLHNVYKPYDKNANEY